ncbi:MAG: ribonuclease H-like domain-containing protein [Spirochaetia bacterium]|nr:ribonuclease H-like domain-containing protein [Spirochaetia bacterium]
MVSNTSKKLSIYFNSKKKEKIIQTGEKKIEHAELFFKKHPLNYKLILKAKKKINFLAQNEYDSKKILFFDVECVNLSFTASNIPFLLGLGYFKEDGFHLEQIFLKNMAHENAMLSFLDNIWQNFNYLVTFNGKSFDIPLIKSRYQLFLKKFPNHFLEHFDLYHILRKIYPQKRSRLIDYENSVLEMIRQDDLPGSMAGQAYFEYQKKNDDTLLKKLFLHNQTDIASMAALALKINSAINESFTDIDKNKKYKYKIYRLKNKKTDPDFIIKNISGMANVDAEDMYYMAKAYKKKKNYIQSYKYFRKAYKKGLSKALPEALVILYYYFKKYNKAIFLIDKYLYLEEASMQMKLLTIQQKIKKRKN